MFSYKVNYSYHVVQNVRRPKHSKLSRILLQKRMFSHEFQSTLALVDVVLMQTWQFICEYSHGDLTVKVLSLRRFTLANYTVYGNWLIVYYAFKISNYSFRKYFYSLFPKLFPTFYYKSMQMCYKNHNILLIKHKIYHLLS